MVGYRTAPKEKTGRADLLSSCLEWAQLPQSEMFNRRNLSEIKTYTKT